MAATREVVVSQILDILSWPRLIKEYVNMYGIVGFVRRFAKRTI